MTAQAVTLTDVWLESQICTSVFTRRHFKHASSQKAHKSCKLVVAFVRRKNISAQPGVNFCL